MTNQAPASPKPPEHVGEIVRRLREAAGLTRSELGQQTQLAESVIKALETRRCRMSPEMLRKLLQHASMATLSELVKAAGMSLGLGDDGIGEK